MINIKESEMYFLEKYNLFCDKTDYINYTYDYNLDFLVDRVLSLYEPDFHVHFENIINSKSKKTNDLNIIKNENEIIELKKLPNSIITSLINGIHMFCNRSYYNSFISVPVFDYLFNYLSSDFLFISHSNFDIVKNGSIEEIFKSTPTILKKIKENNKYSINKIFEFLFTNNYMENDLRSIYSHCLFQNKDHVKSLSNLYYLFIINWFITEKIEGLIYEKK